MKFTHYFFLFLLFANASFAQQKKPNIIFVLADDLGIDGVSAYGADFFKTPVPGPAAGGAGRARTGPGAGFS